MRSPIIMPLLALILLLAPAAGDTFATAKRLYFEAVDGSKESLPASASLFEKLAAADREEPLVKAYLGSVRLLESSRALAPWKKGKLAKEGLGLLDAAVAAAPEHLEVRFLRAASTYHLPGWFKREQQSAADFAAIAPRAGSAVAAGQLDRRLAAAALFYHGLFCEKRSDVRGAWEAWEQAVRIAPESRAGSDAAKRLERLGD